MQYSETRPTPPTLDRLPTLDLFSATVRERSNEVLAELRRATPVCHVRPFRSIGVLRFADVNAVLRDFMTFSSDVSLVPPLPGADETELTTLIRQDPPAHTRVRALVRQALSPARVATMEGRIRRIIRDLIGAIVARGEKFDMMEDFAVPLPVTVIAELLGIDPRERARFKRWSDDLVDRVRAHYAPVGPIRDRRIAEISASAREMSAFLHEAIAQRRAEPAADLISALVHAEEAGEGLEAHEIVNLVRLLLIAGNETTTHLLGLAMNALLAHDGQLELLGESPDLAAGAVEEALRYEGPVVALTRVATKDTELGGVAVPAGALVTAVIASANHDESVFSSPTTFDIRRKIPRHLALGGGVHACVGGPIARLEARLALEEIASTMGRIAPAAPAVRLSGSLRGFASMPLTYVRRSRSAPTLRALRTDATLATPLARSVTGR
jgi:cytochrome P450